MSTNRPFPIDHRLTGIAIAIKNRRLIADDVLPRIPADRNFKYLEHTTEDYFSPPETKVGRKSQVPHVEFRATEHSDSVDDHALSDFVPMTDIDSDNQGVDPLGNATEGVTSLIELRREIRVANLVNDTSNYDAANVNALSTGEYFDDDDSDPIGLLKEALDTPILRPNVGTIGRLAFTALSTHPSIVRSFHRNDGGSGVATREHIAALLELDELYVGESFVNNANSGQAADYARVWTDNLAFHYKDRTQARTNQTVWGVTFEHGTRKAGTFFDSKIGAEGSMEVRVVERLKELVTAKSLGFLVTGVLTP